MWSVATSASSPLQANVLWSIPVGQDISGVINSAATVTTGVWPLLPNLVSQSVYNVLTIDTVGIRIYPQEYTLNDGYSNVDKCNFNVIVDSSVNALTSNLICPSNIDVSTVPGMFTSAAIRFTSPFSGQCTYTSGNKFRIGTTVVYCWTNSSYCSFIVKVTENWASNGPAGSVFAKSTLQSCNTQACFNANSYVRFVNSNRFPRLSFTDSIASRDSMSILSANTFGVSYGSITIRNGAAVVSINAVTTTNLIYASTPVADYINGYLAINNTFSSSQPAYANALMNILPSGSVNLNSNANVQIASTSSFLVFGALIGGSPLTELTVAGSLFYSANATLRAIQFISFTVELEGNINIQASPIENSLFQLGLGTSQGSSNLVVNGKLSINGLANISVSSATITGSFILDALYSNTQVIQVNLLTQNGPVNIGLGDTVTWTWSTDSIEKVQLNGTCIAGNCMITRDIFSMPGAQAGAGAYSRVFNTIGNYSITNGLGMAGHIITVTQDFWTGSSTATSFQFPIIASYVKVGGSLNVFGNGVRVAKLGYALIQASTINQPVGSLGQFYFQPYLDIVYVNALTLSNPPSMPRNTLFTGFDITASPIQCLLCGTLFNITAGIFIVDKGRMILFVRSHTECKLSVYGVPVWELRVYVE